MISPHPLKPITWIVILVLVTTLFSCNPAQKFMGTWEMTRETINGIEQPFNKKVLWEFDGKSNFKQSSTLLGVNEIDEAAWQYDAEKQVIKLDYSGDKKVEWTVRIQKEKRLVVYYNKYGFQVERDFQRIGGNSIF